MRVLIADDHPANLRLLGHIAASQGWRASCVENGLAAIRACLFDGPFDAILLDRRMPSVSGEDAARAIRAIGGWAANAPIVGVTADYSPGVCAQCLAAGMDECLPKPIECATLAHTVRSLTRAAPALRAVVG